MHFRDQYLLNMNILYDSFPLSLRALISIVDAILSFAFGSFFSCRSEPVMQSCSTVQKKLNILLKFAQRIDS